MSIDALQEKEFARRNLWEACLFDHNGQRVPWSPLLIKSVTIPKLSFEISDILAGTDKDYSGFKLPDDIKISIWETSDHMVEQFLDDWMLGDKGVFNMATGAFRTGPRTQIYRKLEITTFIYNSESNIVRPVDKKQVMPGADLGVAVLAGALNNITAKSPIPSNLVRAVFPPVVIPPLLLKQTIEPSASSGVIAKFLSLKDVRVENPFKKKEHESAEPAKIEVTSRIMYEVLIQGYDVGGYDYDKGDGVSYDVNLSVCDMTILEPANRYFNSTGRSRRR